MRVVEIVTQMMGEFERFVSQLKTGLCFDLTGPKRTGDVR